MIKTLRYSSWDFFCLCLCIHRKWKYVVEKLGCDFWPKVNHWFESVWKDHLGKTQQNGGNWSKLWLWIEGWDNLEEKDWQHWKVKQVQPMWICVLLCKQFEDTFENSQWTKVVQMQPMCLCILLCKRFKNTFENTQWRKVKQMQPMWLCIRSCTQFEDTFENAQRR